MNKIKLILVFTFLFIFNVFSASSYSTEEQKALDVLNEYYSASVAGDVDKYLEVQDSLFLKQMELESNINLKEFYQFTFNEVSTSDFSLKNVDISLEDNSVLIFYNLKGKYETKDGESGSIDNDMVAYLWKYDTWKVRWTITRSLYEQKIGMSYAMDVAIQNMFEELNNNSLKEELIAEGIDVSLDNYEFQEKNGFNWIWYILIILFIGLLYLNKDKLKKVKNIKKPKTDTSKIKGKFEKTKNLSMQKLDEGTVKFKEVVTPHYINLKTKTKEIYDNREEHFNNAKSFAKKAGKTIEKHSKKAIKSAKKKIDELKNKK